MKHAIIIFLFLSFNQLFAQTTFSYSFHSDVLNENRNIRIHLPKSFDSTNTEKYPLILVLDGEYLFYSVMGIGEVLTTRQIIPEGIVVGIDQNFIVKEPYSARWFDCSYNNSTGKLDEDGLKFKSFLVDELIPYLTTKYMLSKFKTIVGHSFTANYVNYFLSDNLFSGFIAVSPYIPTSLESFVIESASKRKTNAYYFLCTGQNDLSGHLSQIIHQDSSIFSQIKNSHFKYLFKNYPNETHMSLPVRGISDALCQMYVDYSPIYTLNNDSLLLKEKNLIQYLEKRYENMLATYEISIPIREDDINSVAWVIEEQEKWADLKKIGEIQIKLFPDNVYGYYTVALAEEKQNNLKLALEYYKKGYSKLGDDVGNKSDFYQDIERVEQLIKEKK